MSGPHRAQPREHRRAAALLAAGAARARAGAGGLVLLRGATGTGRTTVLEAAAEDAAAHGMRVLRTRCSPGDATVPFAAVRQLLGPITGFEQIGGEAEGERGEREQGDRLWKVLCSYAEVGPLLLAVDDVHLADPPSHRWLVESARHVDLLKLPILLAVTERSQYDIDPPAPGFAHTLPHAVVHTRTLAPLSANSAAELVRAQVPAATDEWADSCLRAGAGSPLLLRALLDDLAVHECTGARPAVPETTAALYPGAYPAAVSWWLDSSGPGTAEVARALAALDEGWGDEAAEAGEEWWEAVRGGGSDVRSTGLGRRSYARTATPGLRAGSGMTTPDVQSYARTATLAVGADTLTATLDVRDRVRDDVRSDGRRARPADAGPCQPAEDVGRLLAELAGADPVRVAGWVTAMTGLGVLRLDYCGRPRYAHPLLRDAVLTGVPEARRRAARRAAAEAMLHRGAPTEIVARQLLLTDPLDAPWVPGVLQDAASLALHAGRSADALAFLRRALDEPLSDEHRQRLLTELGSLECADNESSAGIPRLTEALRLTGTPHDRVRAAVALGTALTARGRTRAAVEVLRTVDGQLAGHPDLAGTLQSASALLSDHDQTVRREVYRWLLGTAEDSPELVGPAARALLVRYAATAGLISAADAMRQVRGLLAEPADPLTEPFLLGTVAAVAQWADELDEAERLVGRGLADHPASHHLPHPMRDALLNTRADIAAGRGEFGHLARQLTAELPPHADTRPSNVLAHTLIELVETGRAAEAQRLADRFDLGGTADTWERNRFIYARGLQRAAAGEQAAALHDFLECGRRQSAREVVSPVVTPWRTAAAECSLALGNPRQALALAEEELRLARVWGTPRPVGRALRVLGTVTGGRRGLELAGEAVRVLRDAAATVEPELVAALIAQGRQLTALGERSRARGCLREAVERAERIGAVRLRGLADEALREGGARRAGTARTGSESLTGSERRIAQLAADGRTNTEIAEVLHLARRTVETHLTNSYRKLGIRRRSELTASLGAETT
ncbi:LuxR C-terminal-related transcriptional regulator [Streptomyces sp. CA-111067]|uniref:helix-turn-helix transcriptional regulator n=1 Tax=Streptomyces sp. CA-111067 TaxID=3240046 RepID=UPI003D962458